MRSSSSRIMAFCEISAYLTSISSSTFSLKFSDRDPVNSTSSARHLPIKISWRSSASSINSALSLSLACIFFVGPSIFSTYFRSRVSNSKSWFLELITSLAFFARSSYLCSRRAIFYSKSFTFCMGAIFYFMRPIRFSRYIASSQVLPGSLDYDDSSTKLGLSN